MKIISDSFQTISPHFKEVHRLFSMKLQVDFGFSTDFGHVSIHPREVYPSYRYPKTDRKVQKIPEMNSSRAVRISRYQKFDQTPKMDEVR